MFSVQIIGNIGGSCAIRTGQDGKSYNSFQVAVNSGNSVQWFGVLMHRREKLEPYLTKGQKVYVRGDLHVRVNQTEKQIFVDLDIFAHEVELCGANSNNEEK